MPLLNKTAIILLVFTIICIFSLFTARNGISLPVHPKISTNAKSRPQDLSTEPNTFRRKIWQTGKEDYGHIVDQGIRANIISWHRLNPQWQYEMLDSELGPRYVERRYKEEDPEFYEVFTALQNGIMKADLLRYMILLGDGGIYSDLDTECLKSVDEWIPQQYLNQTDVVVGVEYDTFGGDKGEALLPLQLATWTLGSKKGHPLLRLVLKNAIEAIAALAKSQNAQIGSINADMNDVLASTGPARFTLSVWEHLSQELGEQFTWQNVTSITEPMLVNGILFLPITSFGNGQLHSKSGPPTDETALVHHQFKGSWKTEEKDALGEVKTASQESPAAPPVAGTG